MQPLDTCGYRAMLIILQYALKTRLKFIHFAFSCIYWLLIINLQLALFQIEHKLHAYDFYLYINSLFDQITVSSPSNHYTFSFCCSKLLNINEQHPNCSHNLYSYSCTLFSYPIINHCFKSPNDCWGILLERSRRIYSWTAPIFNITSSQGKCLSLYASTCAYLDSME